MRYALSRGNFMNRRTFSQTITGAAVGAAAWMDRRAEAFPFDMRERMGTPYSVSIMLWTVFRKLPFEERLEKVAEAGYRNVELVGEYHREHWSDDEFNRVNAKRKELGITFDTTAGLRHGVGNPNDREAMLADLRNELPIMERLECPACIIMSGNVVPGMPREVQHQSCIEGLKRAAEVIEGKQIAGKPVRLLLENIDPEKYPISWARAHCRCSRQTPAWYGRDQLCQYLQEACRIALRQDCGYGIPPARRPCERIARSRTGGLKRGPRLRCYFFRRMRSIDSALPVFSSASIMTPCNSTSWRAASILPVKPVRKRRMTVSLSIPITES